MLLGCSLSKLARRREHSIKNAMDEDLETLKGSWQLSFGYIVFDLCCF